jgi:hypothetical protein
MTGGDTASLSALREFKRLIRSTRPPTCFPEGKNYMPLENQPDRVGLGHVCICSAKSSNLEDGWYGKSSELPIQLNDGGMRWGLGTKSLVVEGSHTLDSKAVFPIGICETIKD